jgi:hypothetical protein
LPFSAKSFLICEKLLKTGKIGCACFQNRRVGSGRLSKLASWLWPAIETGEMALAGFQKLSAQL